MAKRRKSGTGSIHLRKDGRWEGRVVVGYDENGLPKTRNVLAKTKSACAEKLKALKAECGGAKSDKLKPDMPFGDWLDFWYQNHCKPRLRPTTQQEYEVRIYKHIIPTLGAIPLNKLAQSDLQQFYDQLKSGGRLIRADIYGKGLSDRTVRGCHITCRTALDRAVAEKLISSNPADGCKLPSDTKKEMQVLTPEEMQRLLIQAKEDGCYELLLLELSTGLRRGEILALQWSDLSPETGELRITKQVSRVRGELVVGAPKTRAAVRTIVLPPALIQTLQEYRKNVNSRWMFPSPKKDDSPLDPAAVRKKLSIVLERANCKHVRFHDLRHPYVKLKTKKYEIFLRSFSFLNLSDRLLFVPAVPGLELPYPGGIPGDFVLVAG
jgi:integrase